MTVIGLVLLGLLCIGLAADRLQRPTVVGSDPGAGGPCPGCGWPPWSVLPCLCPEERRGEAFRGADRGAQAIDNTERGSEP